MNILRIDSSARLEGSKSRELADHLEKKLLDLHPGARVTVRDIINDPIPHVSNDAIIAFEANAAQNEAQQQALSLSDKLVDEILDADILLLSSPLYNFCLPSALKAYIDQIVRPGKTFDYDDAGPSGLLKNKTCYVVTALGSYYANSELEGMNLLKPYLEAILGFIGFTDIIFFELEGTDLDPDSLQQRKDAVFAKIEALQ